ncbi:MAG: hypothetical protein K2X32_00375 [Phycisphaerales bacterium]|nr:hypothetical protein [Phycisphaerales bacterium]
MSESRTHQDDRAAAGVASPPSSLTPGATGPVAPPVPLRRWLVSRVLPASGIVLLGLVLIMLSDHEHEPLRPRPDLHIMRYVGAAIVVLGWVGASIMCAWRLRRVTNGASRAIWIPVVLTTPMVMVVPIITVAIANDWSTFPVAALMIGTTTSGMGLILRGLTRRVGASRHCPKCEYQFDFSETAAPGLCPECATAWIGQLRVGAVRFSKPRIALGAALAALPLLVLVLPWGQLLMPASWPTTALVAHARVFKLTGWVYDELLSRPLTGPETDQVALMMLEARQSDRYARTLSSRWLQNARRFGLLSPELEAKVQQEPLDIRLSVPVSARAGRRIKLTLYSDDPFPVTFNAFNPISVTVDGVEVVEKEWTAYASQLHPYSIRRGEEAPLSAIAPQKLGTVSMTVKLSVPFLPFGGKAVGPPRIITLTRELEIGQRKTRAHRPRLVVSAVSSRRPPEVCGEAGGTAAPREPSARRLVLAACAATGQRRLLAQDL